MNSNMIWTKNTDTIIYFRSLSMKTSMKESTEILSIAIATLWNEERVFSYSSINSHGKSSVRFDCVVEKNVSKIFWAAFWQFGVKGV